MNNTIYFYTCFFLFQTFTIASQSVLHLFSPQRYENFHEASFRGLISGVSIDDEDLELIEKSGGHAGYGEILPSAISRIFNRLGLTEKQVFIDLGSGTGKIVFQAAMEFGMKSYGFELSGNRHEDALADLEQYVPKEFHSLINLRQEDVLKAHYPNDVTMFLFAGLLFNDLAFSLVIRKIERHVLQSNSKNPIVVWSVGTRKPAFWDFIVTKEEKIKFHTSWTKVDWTGQVANPQDGWLIWLRRPPIFDQLKPEEKGSLIEEIDSAILVLENRIDAKDTACDAP